MALSNLIGARDKSNSPSSQTQKAPDGNTTKVTALPQSGNTTSASPAPENHPNNSLQASGAPPLSTPNESAAAPPTAEPSDPAASSARPSAAAASNRRWSLPLQFSLLRRVKSSPLTSNKHVAAVGTPAVSAASPDPAPAPAPAPAPPPVQAPVLSSADRRAQKSALLVRSLIVGQNADEGGLASPQKKGMSSALKNVKAQLLEPKTASKILAQLRALPALSNSASRASQPIQAVSLPYLDEEADKLHLSHLNLLQEVKSTAAAAAAATTDTEKTHPLGLTPVAGAAIEAVTKVLRDSHVVSLFSAPNLGLGQPGDGPGLLAGALPTAETVVNGIEQITPQLMALSYATGHPAIPEHKGVYPPTDRMSILTSWWGFELLLPPPTLAYLNRAQSISKTVLNILTALGAANEGVREILPFARYIAQFVDFEFNEIKSQDQGKGVICTATWIMPIAMIPRPWDFSDPPKALQLGLNGQSVSPPSNEAPASPASPLPMTHIPAPTPA